MATIATVRNADNSINETKTTEFHEFLKSNGCRFVRYPSGYDGFEADHDVTRLARKYAETIGANTEYRAGSAQWSASIRVILTA